MRAVSYIGQAVRTRRNPGERSDHRSQPGQQSLGVVRRCLIGATTFRFLPERELEPQHRALFADLAGAGWVFRQASSRNFLCWCNSKLLLETTIPIAIFPSADWPATPAERTMVILFELFRRMARIDLIARGRPGELVDRPDLVAQLARRVAETVWGDDCARESGPRLLKSAEIKIIEAAVGCRVGRSAGSRAFLPPHLDCL